MSRGVSIDISYKGEQHIRHSQIIPHLVQTLVTTEHKEEA